MVTEVGGSVYVNGRIRGGVCAIHCCHQNPFTPVEKDQLPASIVLNDVQLQVKTGGEGKQRKKSRKREEADLPFSAE